MCAFVWIGRVSTGLRKMLVAVLLANTLWACSDDTSTSLAPAVGSGFEVSFVLGLVDAGQCTLNDANGLKIAGPVVTTAGKARFGAMSVVTGMGQVVCEGGNYLDEASGKTLTAPKLRAMVDLSASNVNVSVTPLTEVAVRLLAGKNAFSDYQSIVANVAEVFGLKGINLGAEVPSILGSATSAGNDAVRYGLVLASLSQLETRASLGANVASVLTKITSSFDTKGHVKEAKTRDEFAYALQDLLANSVVKNAVQKTNSDVIRALFEDVAHADVLATIDGIDTDSSLTQNGEVSTIDEGVATTITLFGQDLYLGLKVSLGGKSCAVFNLKPLDTTAGQSNEEEIQAKCPAQVKGTSKLVVTDKTEVVGEYDIIVATAVKKSVTVPKFVTKGVATIGTGTSSITGTVTALAPIINTATGGLGYTTLRTFLVKGVVVELLDRNAADAVITTTSTDDEGKYSFTQGDPGRNVVVRVKAQLVRTLAQGATTGARWNFSVRDNTSAANPKAMYFIDSPATLTTGGVSVVNLQASLGFDATGALAPATAGARQSAPFSILEVVYSAATKLEANDSNINLPELNIYWSPDNVGAPGDRNKGQIGTSHYAGGGALPGVFILGKADVDTDEFDQGVIGHEFGHYLQSMLSFSDSPGGSHGPRDHKDASLAYGEGYGTAVGGLLTGSPFYVDTSGPNQARGGVLDLSQPIQQASSSKGFYSENSVAYVMYNLGVRHGFSLFWRAVSALRTHHFSATIYSFLHAYSTANPSLVFNDLLVTENIRSKDPLGTLPGGTVPDPLISAEASKGTADAGAPDLESLYTALTLSATTAQTVAVNLTPDAPTFCVNRNLSGANIANGLGMSRRHTFVANFTGQLGLKPLDDKAVDFDGQSAYINARDNLGTVVSAFNWDNGFAYIEVVEGRTYTITLRLTNPSGIFNGNRCGNRLTLWRIPA
jgi:hypothetical protein